MKPRFVLIAKCLSVSLTLLYFCLSIAIGADVEFTGDFETGDLSGWTVVEDSGEAWNFQPTFGDNPTARNRGQPSQHQGEWWLGGFEKFQGPDVKGQFEGGTQGDAPQGILESIEFKIIGEEISFLIGGGTHPWVEGGTGSTCANLEINGEMVRTATGANTETLHRETWDVSDLKGEKAVIRLYDMNAGGWGHLNFDDVYQVDANGDKIPWESVLAVEPRGKKTTVWGEIKSQY
ncbi:hypothetical protein GF312_07220 [Candidatus Poribacteria bacterium]|nr:hypothetical protein [Candidatus Poribacteria bacterium]